MNAPKRILPVIVFSQFAGTSLWFAVNAIIIDLQSAMNVNLDDTGIVTSAIQLGFITGTLLFALFSLSDRFSPKKLFLICSLLGAVSNLLIYFAAYNLFSLLVLRFITGFFLTGIYPIGMRIAAGWYRKGLGNAIGLLVGALVLGTAFPHLLKSIGGSLPWHQVIFSVSIISASGGIIMYFFVPDGPYVKSGTKFNPHALFTLFRIRQFRSAAIGYFGHMWELYTFWALTPIILTYYKIENGVELNIFLNSFLIIGAGSVGCIAGGIISKRIGSAKVAFAQLLLSVMCCLIAPVIFQLPADIFMSFLIFWGMVVVGDSPQFSSVIALSAPKELVGSGLTLVNSIGFGITIFSLWFVHQFFGKIETPFILMLLAAGPVIGLVFLKPIVSSAHNETKIN